MCEISEKQGQALRPLLGAEEDKFSGAVVAILPSIAGFKQELEPCGAPTYRRGVLGEYYRSGPELNLWTEVVGSETHQEVFILRQIPQSEQVKFGTKVRCRKHSREGYVTTTHPWTARGTLVTSPDGTNTFTHNNFLEVLEPATKQSIEYTISILNGETWQ